MAMMEMHGVISKEKVMAVTTVAVGGGMRVRAVALSVGFVVI